MFFWWCNFVTECSQLLDGDGSSFHLILACVRVTRQPSFYRAAIQSIRKLSTWPGSAYAATIFVCLPLHFEFQIYYWMSCAGTGQVSYRAHTAWMCGRFCRYTSKVLGTLTKDSMLVDAIASAFFFALKHYYLPRWKGKVAGRQRTGTQRIERIQGKNRWEGHLITFSSVDYTFIRSTDLMQYTAAAYHLDQLKT